MKVVRILRAPFLFLLDIAEAVVCIMLFSAAVLCIIFFSADMKRK